MALLDKLKNAANTAKGKAQAAYDSVKASQAQKKADQEAYNAEMKEKAQQKAQDIQNAIENSGTGAGFFSQLTTEELLSFTKDFYDKILMPANSVSKSHILMHPYITGKKFTKFCEQLGCFDPTDTPIIHITANKDAQILITLQRLYFFLPLEEDPKFIAKGSVDCGKISTFSMDKEDAGFVLRCNGQALAAFAADKASTEDGITLNNYFTCISTKDFEITDEEVDQLIREKIGQKVYAEVKKYMVYDDELLVYFAWGVNSLSAKDYLVCTNKQVILVDREMGGMTANIRQFYYEDITSASVLQNSNSTGLTSFLLETALTAATQTCDLVLSVAGATTKINTLYKVEAERVVAVYHHFRKVAKSQPAPQQVVIQQVTPQSDPMEQLQKLAGLKAAGIITEEEFNQKKAELLSKI